MFHHPKLLSSLLVASAVMAAHATIPHSLAFVRTIDNAAGRSSTAEAITIDAADNIYVLSHATVTNHLWMFVNKLDAVGTQLWRQGTYAYFGGQALNITVDRSHNVAFGASVLSGPVSSSAPIFRLDPLGNPAIVPVFSSTQGGTVRAYGAKFDAIGNLHVLFEELNATQQITSYVMDGAGSIGPVTNVASMQYKGCVAGGDGRMLVGGVNATGGKIAVVGPANTVLFSEQFTDTYNSQTNSGSTNLVGGDFDPNGDFQFAINTTHMSNSGSTLTYTYRSYDASGNLLWHFDNIAGRVGSVVPVGPNEGYYISAVQNTVLHHVTNLGDTWSVQLVSQSTAVRDDTGGCFVLSPVNNGSQDGCAIYKYDSSGTIQWSDSYYPPSGSFYVHQSVVRAGILYLLANVHVNGISQVSVLKYVQGIALAHMGLNSNLATGPLNLGGTVQLNAPAPPGGYLAYLTSTNPSAVGVPPQIIVPAGATTATFNCTVQATDAPQWVTITAQSHGAVDSTALLINPAVLQNLTFSPPTIKVGAFSTGTLTLTGMTGGSGRLVQLSSSNPSAVQVLPTTYIGPGVSTGTFSAKAVGGVGTTVTITATLDGVQKTATVTVSP